MMIKRNGTRASRLRMAWLAALLATCASAPACVKRTVSVPVAPKVREAREATLEEVLGRLKRHDGEVKSLSSTSMRITFSSGRLDSGRLQEYRSAPGYILLKRPEAIRLNVQNPLTKTAILELLSLGDEFSVWSPRDNKFFTGRNSAREFEVEGQPKFSARPIHLFEAILPRWLPEERPDLRIAFEEDQDSVTKYYVLSFYRESGGVRLVPRQRLWVDRSDMSVSRLDIFSEEGIRSSIIRYSNMAEMDGHALPLAVSIERPIDGYLLQMQFKEWRLNPDLPDAAFILAAPEGAERVALRERGRSQEN